MFRKNTRLWCAAGTGSGTRGTNFPSTAPPQTTLATGKSSNYNPMMGESSRTTKFVPTAADVLAQTKAETGQDLIISTKLPVRKEDGTFTTPATTTGTASSGGQMQNLMKTRNDLVGGTMDQSLMEKSKALPEVNLTVEKFRPASTEAKLAFNVNEHPLLCDIDLHQDAVMYGRTPEEFIKNVEEVKKLIINHSRWEKNDNKYYWGTRIAQFGCLVTLFDILRNSYATQVLRSGLSDYLAVSTEEIASLKIRRDEDFRMLKQEWNINPPDFSIVQGNIGGNTGARGTQQEAKLRAGTGGAVTEADTVRSTPVVLQHPMDTSKREDTLLQKQSGKVSEALEMMGAESYATQLYYSNSPTAIPALKAARRVLMPQAEDFTSIVKEEILEHQRYKADQLQHPDKR